MWNLKRLAQPMSFVVCNRIARIKKLALGKNVQALLVPTVQGQFLIDPEDMGVGGALKRLGGYGLEEIERVSSLTNCESNVLFVGSHIGSLVVPISKKVKRVTAIEANPNTFQLLSWNILLNRCDNVRPIHAAASDRREQIDFVISRTNSGGSKRMPLIKAHKYFYDHPTVIKVNAVRLDDCLSDKFDLVLMDIEGSEYFALKGMERILSNAAHLVVEFLPHHLKNVSGVAVAQFLAPIEPYFDLLAVPSKNLTVDRSQFLSTLERMYDLDESDDGVVFSKLPKADQNSACYNAS